MHLILILNFLFHEQPEVIGFKQICLKKSFTNKYLSNQLMKQKIRNKVTPKYELLHTA